MLRSNLKKGLIIAVTFASFMSYAYLNCCASVKNQILPVIQQEQVQEDFEKEGSLKLPDMKMLEKSLEIIRVLLPAS